MKDRFSFFFCSFLFGSFFFCCFLFFSFLFTPVLAQKRTVPPLVVDVEHYEISAELVPAESFLKGEAKIRFVPLEDMVSVPFELNNRLSLLEVTNEEDVRYSLSFDDFDSTRMRVRGPQAFQSGTQMTLIFRFEGTLDREEYAFLDTPQTERAVIHPEGGLLLSEGKWFPMHGLPLDAASATVKITVPLGFTVVAPGTLESIETVGVNEVFTWKSEQPVTRIPVAVARFFRQQFDNLPLPLTFFVTEEFSRDLRPFADEVGQMLEFFQSEYGSYPITALNFVQVGNVELPSPGCLGLILLESTLLQGQVLPVMELARRVARQWWGYSLRFERTSDAWLQDGFATYAALRYFEVKHPDRFSIELAREAVLAFKYESKAPISKGLELESGSPEYKSIVSSKGAWVLYMLSQLVGKEKFNATLGEWYRQKAQQAATTAQLVDFFREQTGEDYRWFFAQWVESVGVPDLRVEYTIYKLRDGNFKIRGQIKQNLELFRMPMDLVVVTKGQPEEKQLNVRGKSTSFSFQTQTMPLRIELDPHGKILRDSKRMRVAVHVALGDEYRAKGEFVAAIREFEKARELNPRSSLAHFSLGEVFFEQRNLSSAANSFRDTLNGDLKPEWVETWTYIYLGKVYDILGQRQRALAEYRKAINTKIDYNGAQAEAQKYQKEPYSKPRSVIG
ncbi:tetratricopeptide repeat protein [Acidobacteria bacterium AH-259-G07]|nr:tetratricopeptide repeat protein [Acidobacteria bacterium AH-259-G07]